MNLELEFIEITTSRRGESFISFQRKSGLIAISSEFYKKSKVKDVASVSIAKDPNRKNDWYLIVFKDEFDPKGLLAKRKNNAGANFNCSSFTSAFLECFSDSSETYLKVPLSTVGTEIMDGRAMAYAILTKALDKK